MGILKNTKMVCKVVMKISAKNKDELERLKVHPRQSYNEVVAQLIKDKKLKEEGNNGGE